MILTVGHSNLAIDDFIDVLRHHEADTLVDVRRRPVSSRFPWFTGDALRERLNRVSIDYRFAGHALGGLRPPGDDHRHAALAGAMRGYAAHMQSAIFRRAADRLMTLCDERRLAIMCAERDPACCHRSLIADYLYFHGVGVAHIVGRHAPLPHQPHPAARALDDGIAYDRHTQQQLC